MKDEAMDVAQSAPQVAHYHAGVINLILQLEVKRSHGAYCIPSEGNHQLGPQDCPRLDSVMHLCLFLG